LIGRHPDRAIWINGRICRGEEAALSLFDRGARDGEGLFETLRVYAGSPFLWERHMERLVLSAAELGFPVPASPSVLAGALREVLAAEGLSDAVVRVTVTRGVPGGRPTRTGSWVEAEPIEGRLWRGTKSGRGVAVFSKRPFEPAPLGSFKTTSRLAYQLARDEARSARADEALLVSPRGWVLEGATSNLFALVEEELLTPPLACGILPGITRALVLTLCAELGLGIRESPITREQLLGAREVFLTNSVQEIVPLAELEGRAVPEQVAGPRLQEAYRAAVSAACGRWVPTHRGGQMTR
jgi:branched-subunit amino acid aminotransferase/4-amino-4-deoxychorismate lyase